MQFFYLVFLKQFEQKIILEKYCKNNYLSLFFVLKKFVYFLIFLQSVTNYIF